MRIYSSSQPTTLLAKDGRKQTTTVKNLDVVMSTREINLLIASLKILKKEGRWPKGYHEHLNTDEPEGDPRLQVTLCHKNGYVHDPKPER